MKILIADDEQLVRISLKSMIQEMDRPWEIVGEAVNGEEMLELLRRHQPELAIVDIRMPKLDGIEAIREGQKISPHTRWIILSGFSDFHYAQQAVKMGVSEYLLKPVVPEDLEKAIDKVAELNKEYRSLRNYQFENRFYSLCQGVTTLADESADSLLRSGKFQAIIFYFDGHVSAQDLESLRCEFNATIRKAIPDSLRHGAQLALFSLTGSESIVIGVWESEREEARRSVQSFLRQTEAAAERFRSGKLAITGVLTEECGDFASFQRQIQLARELKHFQIVGGMNRIWRLKDVQQHVESGAYLELSQYLHRLADHYINQVYLDYQSTVDHMRLWLSKHAGSLTECMWRNISEYIQLIFGLPISSMNGQEWLDQLKEYGERWLSQTLDEADSSDLIDQVIRYLEENYMQNISLNQIADELKVTPSYLSNLFHRKTGTTFVRYLIRLRILKAKELLSATNMPVQKVAERVGYYSARYFTRLFVETVGIYPSEYRVKLGRIRRKQGASNPIRTGGKGHVANQSQENC